jgi:hypothetical protein
MSNQHVAAHATKLAAEAVKELPPLKAEKNVFLAFVLGFVFGPLGIAIYFKSVADFFICLAMLIAMSFLLVFGPGEILGWMFSAGYGAWRAHTSNQNIRVT